MPTTSNFGWTTPADTDLVKDGAAAIRTLGNGIDTSFLDLKGGTSGQVLSKNSNTDLDYTWITPNVGDITEVQAGTGISVASGTGPIPVITNTVATAFDAAGDLVYGTGADTFTKLSLGTAGKVLTVNSGATAPEWVTPAAGGGYTLLNSGGTALSGSPINITSISQAYVDLYLVVQDWQLTGNAWSIRFNNSSSSDYYQVGQTIDGNGTAGIKGNAQSDKFDMGLSPSSGNQLNTSIIWIRNYADSTCAKVGRIQHFMKASTNREMSDVGIGYYNTTAISEINLIVDSPQTFNGGTYFLYGVK